jgi:hypothetical protein
MKWIAFGRAVFHLLSSARRTRSASARCQQPRILTYLAAVGYRPFVALDRVNSRVERLQSMRAHADERGVSSE